MKPVAIGKFTPVKIFLLRLSILLVVIFCFPALKVSASDYFWVGGSGNWSDIQHWAATSGGAAYYQQIPTPADDVHFDKNSFTLAGQTVTLDVGNAVCRDMDWTGALNNPAFKAVSPGNSIRIYGSLTLIIGMVWSTYNIAPNQTFVDISFESVSAGRNVTTAGQPLNNIAFNGVGGGWALKDSLQCAGSISLNNGSLDTKGNGIQCLSFSSTSSNTRALTIANSVITANSWAVWGGNFALSANKSTLFCRVFDHLGGAAAYYNVVFPGTFFGGLNAMSSTNCTFNKVFVNGSVLNYSGSDNTINFLSVSNGMTNAITSPGFNNDVIHRLVVHGLGVISGASKIDTATFFNDAAINGSNTFGILTFSPGGTYTLQNGNTQLITALLAANGTCTNAVAIQSSVAGMPATIKQTGGTVTVNYVSLRDINAIGGAVFTANNSVDLGDNAGWAIHGSTSLQLYWVGGSGNWSDTNHWSGNSGGAGGACVPTAADDVHFDKNSFGAAGQAVSLDIGTAVCRDMDWTGALNTPAFKGISPGNSIRIYGSLTLIAGMAWSVSNTQPSPSFVNISFESLTTGRTITTAGQQLNKITFNGIGGGWALKDPLQCADTLSLNHGSFDTKGYSVNCLAFASITENARALTIANSAITANTWNVTGSNFTLSADKSTIYCSSFTHEGTPSTYYNVVLQSSVGNEMVSITCTFNKVTTLNSGFSYSGNGNTVNIFAVNNGMTFAGFENDVIHKLIVDGKGIVYGGNKIDTAIFYNDAFVAGNSTFGVLTLSPGGTYTLSDGSTQLITSSLIADGVCTNAITIQSQTAGNQTSIRKIGGTVGVNYVSLRDINATGGAAFIADNSVDLGDNSGWTINNSASRQLYWVGGAGNWNDINHWSVSSGGPGGACIPTAVDDVHLDKNSFAGPGQGVTVNVGNAVCRDMDWTGVADNTALRTAILNGSISIYGSLKLVAGVVWTIAISFESVTPGKTVTTAGVYLNNVTFDGIGGGWALTDNLLCSGSIALYNGGLDTKGNDVSCDDFFCPPGGARMLIMSNSNITARAWQTYGDNFMLTAVNSTLTCKTFDQNGSPATYNNVVLQNLGNDPSSTPSMQSTNCTFNNVTAIDIFAYNGSGNIVNFFTVNQGMGGNLYGPDGTLISIPGFTNDIIHKLVVHGLGLVNGGSKIDTATFYNDAIINGSNTFGTAIFSPGNTYTLQSGKIQTITDSLMLRGNGCFPIRLQSSSVGSPSIISKASKNVAADYVEMRDQTATGGANFYAGKFSSNVSGNSGWIFKNAPGYSYGLGPDTSYCISDGGLLINTDNFNGGVSWLWQDGSTKPTYQATKPGTYWVQVNYAPNCFFRDTINVAENPLPTAVASNNTPICIGDTLKLHASGGTSYQWTGPGGFRSNLQNPVILNAAASASGTYSVIAKSGGCDSPPAATVVTVASGLKTDVSISATSTTICAGTNITFTAVPVNGGDKPFYQWKQNGVNAGTNSPTFTTNAIANNDKIWCVLTSSFNCADPATNPATSNKITVTVNPVLPPGISISTPSSNICAGTTVTFTAKPVNGGALPGYQWQVNGQNAGTNSDTFSSSSLANGDVISCVITSNASCLITPTATSNSITMIVNPNISPSVSIAASANNICAGAPVTFTATPTNEGASPVYQWYRNTTPDGTNSPTYSSSILANGDAVSCAITSNAACLITPNATSNSITMNVTPNVSPSVSIVASINNICAGTPVTFTATPANEGASPVYQWYHNTTPEGINGPAYSSSTLANGDVISCVITSNATCLTTPTATSNGITMNVTPNVSPSVSIAASVNNICAGTSVTFTATPTNEGTAPVYQWYRNNTPDGANSPTYSNGALNSGDVINCVLTSNVTCLATPTATSNSITMVVTPNVSPLVSIAASVNNICAGTPVTFTATPINGGASAVYQWYNNATPVGGNSPVYSSSTLANGDVITCVITSNAPCLTAPTATSNGVTMGVTSYTSPLVTIAANTTTTCAGTQVTFTATPTNGGASPAYQWALNGIVAGTNSDTFSAIFANGDVINCTLTANAPCSTTATATSNSITLTVTSQITPSVSIAASANNVCAGTPVTFTATPGNGIPNPVYQWLVNGSNAGTNSVTFTSSTLANGDLISCIISTSAACAIQPNATSNSIAMVVNPNLNPSVSISASLDNICSTTPVTFTASPKDAGASPGYQWLLNGNNVGSNNPTYINSNLANGDKITCVMTVNDPCTAPVVSTSNAITITVTQLVTPSVSIAALGGSVCAGSPATFTATPVNGGNAPVYQWMVNGNNAGDNSPTFTTSTLNDGDMITCNVANNAACAIFINAKSNSITVKVNPLPIVDAGSDKTIDRGGTTILTATASANLTDITWSPPDGLDNNKILNPKASPASTTVYTLAVQNANGCIAVDSVKVNVLINILIPNTFTPNDDGVNDKWEIKNLRDYQNCSVQIFNRWGQPVYTSRGYGKPWDGTYAGKKLSFGTYYYIIDLNNGSKALSGFIAIVR